MTNAESQRPTYEFYIGGRLKATLQPLINAFMPPREDNRNSLTPPRKDEDRKREQGKKFTERIGNKLSEEINASKRLALSNQETDFFNRRLAVHIFSSLWGEDELAKLDAWGKNEAALLDYMEESRNITSSFLLKDTTEAKVHKRVLDLAARNITYVVLTNQNKKGLQQKVLNRFSTDETDTDQDTLLVLGVEDQKSLTIACERWRNEIVQHRPPTPPLPHAA